MAQFGKADIGLIKATAGAEQSKFVDDNLMTGMAISGLVDELNKKSAIQDGINASIKKDMDEKFTAPSVNLPEQFAENIGEFIPGEKNKYASVKGGGILSRNKQNVIINGSHDYVVQTETLVSKILANNNKDISNGPGHDKKTAQYLNQVSADDYKVFTAYDKKGNPQPNIAVPLRVEPKTSEFTFTGAGGATGNVGELLDKLKQDPNYEMSSEEKEAKDNYEIASENYKGWNKDLTLANGDPNPEKYQFYNHETYPDREANPDNAKAELAVYNKNVSLLDSPQDHENIKTANTYGGQYFNQVAKYNGVELQHAMFTDASNDEVDNAYGNLFINQTGKDPDMYKDKDGNPITMILTTQVNGKDKIAKIQYGSDDWMGLDDSAQKKLLQMHIRGEGSDGKYNPEKNSDFHKSGYARFMGNVTRDAGLIKQRQYFENKGIYFDNGDGNPINKTTTETRKNQAYTYHKFDAAFPERLLSDNMGFGQQPDDGRVGLGKVELALKEEFPDIKFKYPPGGNIIKIGDEVFDFSSTNISKKQQLEKLKKHIHEINKLDSDGMSLAQSMSNSVKDDDWKKMRRKKGNYHGYGSVAEGDYLAFKNENVSGMPAFENPDIEAGFEENYGTNSVTGKLEVILYDEETKMYTVKDERGNEHQVDEDTLYPNGI